MPHADRVTQISALVASDLEDNPPEGFKPIPGRIGYHMMMAQFYGKMEDGMLVAAFRCSPRHMNNHGTCHGGMLAGFADFAAYAVRLAAKLDRTSIPTVTLSLDYLRPVRLGDWVEARTELTKQGKSLLFSRMTATVEGKTVFTASGIFTPRAADPNGITILSGITDEA